MSANAYRYVHLDVFTDRPFGGNQLAVFTNPLGMDAGLMQAITREKNFSECTFVFPPEDPATDVRVRIFTPGKEMPMAGHPTIGTAFALAHDHSVAPGTPSTVFGLGVGPVPVDLTWDKDRLSFAWMTQLRPTFGEPVRDVDTVAAALHIAPSAISATGLPMQQVSCGVPFLLVPLASRADVDMAWTDGATVERLGTTLGVTPEVFLFSMEPAADDATVYSRMFAPGLGVAEDPATGAASGPLGSYLVRHNVVRDAARSRIVSLQGVKMGRPSRIHIAIDTAGDQVTRVRVGGVAVVLGEGTLRL